jgi:cytidylate kinase
MKEQTREDPTILAAAERQMHAWALQKALLDQAVPHATAAPSTQRAISFVTISREAGTCGSQIAQNVGQQLGWNVFDKNLLDQIASRFHLPRTMLELVDETPNNWAYDVLGTWMDRKLVPHDKYVAYLSRVVLAVARRGHAVFVGRGAQFLLPRQEILAVRLIASPRYRLRRIMERMKMDEAKARRYASEVDQGRQEFIKRFFHHDSADDHLYDLVINVEQFGTPGTVAEILAAVGREPLPTTAAAAQG